MLTSSELILPLVMGRRGVSNGTKRRMREEYEGWKGSKCLPEAEKLSDLLVLGAEGNVLDVNGSRHVGLFEIVGYLVVVLMGFL